MSISLCRHAFRAMNTDIYLDLAHDHAQTAHTLLHQAALFFAQVDHTLSRFRPTSELSRLNRERHLVASDMLWEVLQYAAHAHASTDGTFDPRVGQAMLAAGYTTSFENIGTGNRANQPSKPQPTPSQLPPLPEAFWQSVQTDAATRQISLHGNVMLDFGGIAKGWAIDRAYDMLSPHGECCINAGGDVRVSATYAPPNTQLGWPITLESPFGASHPLTTFNLRNQAAATSGIHRRWWHAHGREQHHLIDPNRQSPIHNPLLCITVVAPTAIEAEIATKAAFVLGVNDGWTWLKARNLPALMVLRDGRWFGDLPTPMA